MLHTRVRQQRAVEVAHHLMDLNGDASVVQVVEPDRLDIQRNTAGHLAFAGGLHYCLGGPLARVETRIALGQLLSRYPGLRPAPQQLLWREVIVAREPTALLVDLHDGGQRDVA